MPLPHEHSAAFLEAAPDAMVIVDATSRIALVNVAAEALFEYPRAELLGRRVEMLVAEAFRERHASELLRCFTAPGRHPQPAGLELCGRCKDGTEFPLEVGLSPVTTPRGLFVVHTMRDITARKAFELELIEARELAERAGRGKSELLAAASHDLLQPLQTLTVLGNALRRMLPADSKAAAAVASQAEALRLMADLLRSLVEIDNLEADATSANAVGEGPPASDAAPSAGAHEDILHDGELVVVIDDDDRAGDTTAVLFGTAGLEAIVAAGSEQALRAIASTGRPPALLVCDYELARGETGVDAIRTVREATGMPAPAILLSADTWAIGPELRSVDRCFVLSKPVDADRLLYVATLLLRSQSGGDAQP